MMVLHEAASAANGLNLVNLVMSPWRCNCRQGPPCVPRKKRSQPEEPAITTAFMAQVNALVDAAAPKGFAMAPEGRQKSVDNLSENRWMTLRIRLPRKDLSTT
jgi:hypothetical protein